MQHPLAGGDDPSRQQTALLYESGSFTGYWQPPSPAQHLAAGYLTGGDDFKQPLCGNEEGWGPLSRLRYDFTPCFLDVWVASVAAFGLLFGLAAVVWLLRSKKSVEIGKGWHFWTKQVREEQCRADQGELVLWVLVSARANVSRSHRASSPSSLPTSPPSSSYKSSTTL